MIGYLNEWRVPRAFGPVRPRLHNPPSTPLKTRGTQSLPLRLRDTHSGKEHIQRGGPCRIQPDRLESVAVPDDQATGADPLFVVLLEW